MAVLFSAVTVTSDSDQAEFLVAGVPKSYADLEGWTAFESFMNEVDTEQDIKKDAIPCGTASISHIQLALYLSISRRIL